MNVVFLLFFIKNVLFSRWVFMALVFKICYNKNRGETIWIIKQIMKDG